MDSEMNVFLERQRIFEEQRRLKIMTTNLRVKQGECDDCFIVFYATTKTKQEFHSKLWWNDNYVIKLYQLYQSNLHKFCIFIFYAVLKNKSLLDLKLEEKQLPEDIQPLQLALDRAERLQQRLEQKLEVYVFGWKENIENHLPFELVHFVDTAYIFCFKSHWNRWILPEKTVHRFVFIVMRKRQKDIDREDAVLVYSYPNRINGFDCYQLLTFRLNVLHSKVCGVGLKQVVACLKHLATETEKRNKDMILENRNVMIERVKATLARNPKGNWKKASIPFDSIFVYIIIIRYFNLNSSTSIRSRIGKYRTIKSPTAGIWCNAPKRKRTTRNG